MESNILKCVDSLIEEEIIKLQQNPKQKRNPHIPSDIKRFDSLRNDADNIAQSQDYGKFSNVKNNFLLDLERFIKLYEYKNKHFNSDFVEEYSTTQQKKRIYYISQLINLLNRERYNTSDKNKMDTMLQIEALLIKLFAQP
jgi:hypothetical protein